MTTIEESAREIVIAKLERLITGLLETTLFLHTLRTEVCTFAETQRSCTIWAPSIEEGTTLMLVILWHEGGEVQRRELRIAAPDWCAKNSSAW